MNLVKPAVNYYLQSKYLECKTISGKNILVAGMMAMTVNIYKLIRDRRADIAEHVLKDDTAG